MSKQLRRLGASAHDCEVFTINNGEIIGKVNMEMMALSAITQHITFYQRIWLA